MSWSARGLLIHAGCSREYPSLLTKLGLAGGKPASYDLSFDDVPSLETDLAVACVDGWTTLWSNLVLDYLDHDGVKQVSKTADILLVTWQGAVGFAEFAWWSGGSLRRWRLVSEGEVNKDVGKPLPQEVVAFSKTDDDEDRLWLMMEEWGVPRLNEAQFTVYQFPDITKKKPMVW
jgi:hypothetical protein